MISQLISEGVTLTEGLLTSTVTIQSPNTSHNGNYSCKANVKLPNGTLVIGESNDIVLSLEGKSFTLGVTSIHYNIVIINDRNHSYWN